MGSVYVSWVWCMRRLFTWSVLGFVMLFVDGCALFGERSDPMPKLGIELYQRDDFYMPGSPSNKIRAAYFTNVEGAQSTARLPLVQTSICDEFEHCRAVNVSAEVAYLPVRYSRYEMKVSGSIVSVSDRGGRVVTDFNELVVYGRPVKVVSRDGFVNLVFGLKPS